MFLAGCSTCDQRRIKPTEKGSPPIAHSQRTEPFTDTRPLFRSSSEQSPLNITSAESGLLVSSGVPS